MNDYKLNKTDRMMIHEMRKEYLAEIDKAIDDYWEIGIVESSDFYTITDDCENSIGYVVINSDKVIVQFYLKDKWKHLGSSILKDIVRYLNIAKIWLPTYYDYAFMLACDFSNVHQVTDNLYALSDFVARNDISYPLIRKKFADENDLDMLINFYYDNIPGSNIEWLKGYCDKWIKLNGILLFYSDDDLIGAGEIRHEDFADSFAFLGIAVANDFRRQGFGTYITSEIRNIAIERKLQPICSVDLKNIPSIKMIEASGFFAYDRIIVFDI